MFRNRSGGADRKVGQTATPLMEIPDQNVHHAMTPPARRREEC
jgi:hypothetical protein